MLRFNIQFTGIQFEGDKYMRDLDRAIRKVMREAARDWLIAVLGAIESAGKTRKGKVTDPYTISDKFPIVTGEAKGSLIPLGRALHVHVPVRPKPGRPNRIARGMSKGKFEYPIERAGAGSVDRDYTFNFISNVKHFEVNERDPNATNDKDLLSQTPWEALKAGRAAFRETMLQLELRVPRVKKYVVRRYAPIGTGYGYKETVL